jgi:lysophospholipase L1-like esterase
MMNFSGANKPAYKTLRQSLVFIGDSITWGVGLQNQSQTFAYKIQQKINSRYGVTPATWAGGFMSHGTAGGNYPGGVEIVARNINSDDTNSAFIAGLGEGTQFWDGWLLDVSSATVTDASFGIYPFSSSTGDATTNVKSAANWASGAVTLFAGDIKFTVHYPTPTGYIIVGYMGAGRYQLLGNGTIDLGTFTAGAKFTGTVNQFSPTLTINSVEYGTISAGSYLYADSNALSSPFGDTANTITNYTTGTSTLTMSVASPVTGTFTFYSLEGSTKFQIVGPFSSSSLSSIWIRWLDFVPVFTVLHPTVSYPTTYTTVQIHGRLSYGIGDFSSVPNYPFSGNADVAAKQIMAATIHNDELIAGGFASRPTYVLCLGINDIFRGISATEYGNRLYRLANALQNTNYRNYGRAVLTIPLEPISPNLIDVTREYKKAIIDVAKQLKCSYIDLSRLKLTSADYRQDIGNNDGLHPGPSGTTKIANYIANMLEL